MFLDYKKLIDCHHLANTSIKEFAEENLTTIFLQQAFGHRQKAKSGSACVVSLAGAIWLRTVTVHTR
jgi:hypothetical protein